MGVRRAAAALAAVVAAILAPAGCACSKVRQVVSIASPDAELQVLIASCSAHLPAPGERCSAASAQAASIDCGCQPLCLRVLEIIDQFPGPESIEECHLSVPQEGGARVIVTYRPSTCG
jgi:hypothetical protein